MKLSYPAILEFHKDGRADVVFPDFPGCVSQGRDKADAQTQAQEALQFHIDGLQEDSEPILPASIPKLKAMLSNYPPSRISVVIVEAEVKETPVNA